ncbi:MAG: transposase, partial [Puniceicoccales bacterium]
MSRTVNGEALFGDREKEVFRRMIWQVAQFSGVRVMTYAVMKNHFHILVEVPPEGTVVSDEEIVRRYRLLYPRPTPWQPMR